LAASAFSLAGADWPEVFELLRGGLAERLELVRLDRLPAELLGAGERGLDVLDAYEEQHGIGATLERTDRCRERALDPGIHEGVAGEGAVRVCPTEQLSKETREWRRGPLNGSRRE